MGTHSFIYDKTSGKTYTFILLIALIHDLEKNALTCPILMAKYFMVVVREFISHYIALIYQNYSKLCPLYLQTSMNKAKQNSF